ncbi:MAG: hypothetical protein ACC653_09135 [Gammaproteobacteria bacterium]
MKTNNNQYLSIELTGMENEKLKKITVAYQPVWIYKRSKEEVEQLALNTPLLSDSASKLSAQPAHYRNHYRSQLAQYFVFKPMESMRSCQIRYLDNPDTKLAQLLNDNNLSWLGGFTESCFGSVYDLSGRRYRGTGKENQKNLLVPEYTIQESSINNVKQQVDVIQFDFKSMVLH